jgi:hypothetical protein
MSKNVIRVDFDKSRGIIMAWLEGEELAWESGKSSDEAIVKVVRKYGEKLGIKIIEKE